MSDKQHRFQAAHGRVDFVRNLLGKLKLRSLNMGFTSYLKPFPTLHDHLIKDYPKWKENVGN